jgi:hypothetical protein
VSPSEYQATRKDPPPEKKRARKIFSRLQFLFDMLSSVTKLQVVVVFDDGKEYRPRKESGESIKVSFNDYTIGDKKNGNYVEDASWVRPLLRACAHCIPKASGEAPTASLSQYRKELEQLEGFPASLDDRQNKGLGVFQKQNLSQTYSDKLAEWLVSSETFASPRDEHTFAHYYYGTARTCSGKIMVN